MRIWNAPHKPADQVSLHLHVSLQLDLTLIRAILRYVVLLLDDQHGFLLSDSVCRDLHDAHEIHYLHRDNELRLRRPRRSHLALALLRRHAPLVVATHLHHALVDHRR